MISKKFTGERLLEIDNGHVPSCGPPPSLDGADYYVGYFENAYGEQWVFLGDRKTGKAVIRGGDVGWETEHAVSLKEPCPNLILNPAEQMWIITCFMAMSGTSFDEVVKNYNQTARRLIAATRKEIEEQGQ